MWIVLWSAPCWSAGPRSKRCKRRDRTPCGVFFRKHHSRKEELIESRIKAIGEAMPALKDRAVVEAKVAVVKVSVQLIQDLQEGIEGLNRQIQEAAEAHPDFFIFDSLPGAGAVMAPRLLAAFGSQRERYQNAAEMQTFSGIAPVTESSGSTSRKRKEAERRLICSVGDRPTETKVRNLVAWIEGERETKSRVY